MISSFSFKGSFKLNMAVTKCVSARFILIWKTFYLTIQLQRWFVNIMMYFISLLLTQSKLSLLLILHTMVVLIVASVTLFSDKNRCL